MGELHFREATLDDATFSADVQTALFPARPTDPAIERYAKRTGRLKRSG